MALMKKQKPKIDIESIEIPKADKPPLGLTPKRIDERRRFYDICNAITRYYDAGLKIPLEWVAEYNDLVGRV